MPAEGDIVCLHVGPTRSTKDFRSIFRLTTARVDAALDCSEKVVHLIYQDESVRGRKASATRCVILDQEQFADDDQRADDSADGAGEEVPHVPGVQQC